MLRLSYQELQVLRFAVEEINNSTSLLPGVFLGYEVFDYCSNFLNLEAIIDYISVRSTGSVQVPRYYIDYQPKVEAVIGTSVSSKNLVFTPIFAPYLLPVLSHGASSIRLSTRNLYPSHFRTIPSDKHQVQAILRVLQKFKWNWVALIGDGNDYSNDGLQALKQQVDSFGICVAYEAIIPQEPAAVTNLFSNITFLRINTIVVFASTESAVSFIQAAIAHNVSGKVWIGSETWSLNRQLLMDSKIQTIGTVIGITITIVPLPGFREFVLRSMAQSSRVACINVAQEDRERCNQECLLCSKANPEDIAAEDPMYSFSIYSAVYAFAHSVHSLLGCDNNGCQRSGQVLPYMIFSQLKTVKFDLLNYTVQFDENGDPPPNYEIVVWDKSMPQLYKTIGSYSADPQNPFILDEKLIRWHTNGTVPISVCSVECKTGYRRKTAGVHQCCFDCEICANGTYLNITADPYTCKECREDEWADPGSTSCNKRTVEYLHYGETLSVLVLMSAGTLFTLSGAVALVFALHCNTPVVKSAGGNMCFFMLGCLSLSGLSIFFYFEQPRWEKCILRNPMFAVFYTACLSCLAVRSFQIVCIFKMASKLPKAYDFWVKNHGQWLAVVTITSLQALLCAVWIGTKAPQPFNNTRSYKDQIICECDIGNPYAFVFVIAFVALLSVLCFVFSYAGTDLPKNYNEAKCITFSLLIFFFSWILYLTAYLIYKGKYISAINAGSVLASLYGILLGYFAPKCYVILLKPEHNTPAHFQTCIQSYTRNISSM
ncbi:taste receptor type 1 member 1-like [Amia ocellicauda]|uniref:taste receptor type 1 member 1-like n=1 Tax=Amia ocellicauda TaxID=2972642 RepID=UPI003464E332